jgi:hypothetical protein
LWHDKRESAYDLLPVTGKEQIMARDISNQVQYYYDSHPTKEDLMGETVWHSQLIDYLKAVLIWLFRGQTCAVYENLNFYQTFDADEYPVAPDLAVIKGVPLEYVTSWAPGRIGVPPPSFLKFSQRKPGKRICAKSPGSMAAWVCKNTSLMIPMIHRSARQPLSASLGGDWMLDAEKWSK